MAPPQHARLASLNNVPERRRSVIVDADGAKRLIREAFVEVDKVCQQFLPLVKGRMLALRL
jgi:hypothetical protein